MKIELTRHFIFFFALFCVACNELTDRQSAEAKAALTQLGKLQAATEVGVTKSEYSKLLIDGKAAVNNAATQLPDSSLKQKLQETIQNYIDVGTIWDTNGGDKIIPVCTERPSFQDENAVTNALVNIACNPAASELMRTYKLPLRDTKSNEVISEGYGVLLKQEATSTIAETAKNNLKAASSLVQ